jgi:glycosyltransferase involved in cell wall biosynthesis
MRIIILGTAHPYRGGLSAFNERLARAYSAQGHEVEIYTFTLQYPSFLFPGKTQYTDAAPPQDLTIYRKVHSLNPLNWWKTGREIRRKEPDILIIKFWLPFFSPCFGTIARIVRKNKHTRVVAILDNVIPHEQRTGDKQLIRYFVRSVDGCVAMSRSVLSDWALFDAVKPALLQPHPLYDHYGDAIPVDKAKACLHLPQDAQYALFFGIVRPYKGLDLLIEAFADERLRALNVKLIVAGEFYQSRKPYLEQIQRLNLQEAILLHPYFIPEDRVRLYFNACSIVVQPYKSATQSGVTQIAYHFLKPMLVTDVGALAEMVPHQQVGYVVPPRSEDIAEALVDFFQNDRQAAFVQNISIEKTKYGWENMIEKINEVYTHLLTKTQTKTE